MRIDCRKGFTIVEVLIVAILLIIIAGGAITVYIMTETSWTEGTTQVRLQRRASIFMEKMIRGVGDIYGIREASAVSAPISSQVNFTVDSVSRSFYKSGNQVFYNDGTSDTSLAEDVSDLTFTVSGDTVEIDLTMESQVRDNTIRVKLDSGTTIRN